MPPMIRKAITICIETLEDPGPEWSPGDREEAKDMLSHLLVQRFKADRTDRAIMAAAKAVLAADPPRSES